MRLLHTSDWHLGMTFRGGITYSEDQKYVLNEICRIAVEEKVDGILLAGDVFDKSIASQEAIRMYDERMTYICGNLGIPVYLIAGNHDGAERLSQCNELLKNSGLFISGSLSREPQVVRLEGVDIYLLPWISTDKVRTVFPEDAENISSMEDAYKKVLDTYRESFIPGNINILVSHAFIVNAETSVSDRAAEIGSATAVGSYVFEGFDYVALGHLHGPQQINEHIRYSGTPMAYSFGKEERQEKSVTIFDTDTLTQIVVPVPQLRKRITLSGSYDELMNGSYDDDVLNAYIKLDITDSYVGVDSIAAFREKFPNMLEITGKSLDYEGDKITMTIEEFESLEMNPESVFKRYCEDTLGEAPMEHWVQLFEKAVNRYEKEGITK